MCKAKIDGGKRCEHDLRSRVANLQATVDEMSSWIDEIQGDMIDDRNTDSERKKAGDYLQVVLNEIRTREHRIAKYESQLKLVPSSMQELQEKIDAETDPKKKEELKAEQTSRLQEIEKQYQERQEAFRSQKALRQVFGEIGVPKESQDEVIKLIIRDSKTSQLRSSETYKEQMKRNRDEISYLKNVWAEEQKDKAYEQGRTPEECEQLAKKVDEQLVTKVASVQKRLDKAVADYRCTAEGLDKLVNTVRSNRDKRWAELQALYRAGDTEGAVTKQEQMLEAYERGVDLIQISTERRNARTSDRNIRDTVRRLVKSKVSDAGGSPEDFKRAMNAIKKPETVEITDTKQEKPEHEQIAVMFTEAEAQTFESFDMDTIQARITQLPRLPQGKTLNDVHDEFKRHSNGKGHRQSTVQGELRTKRIHFTIDSAEAQRIRGRAKSLETSLSSYARQMALQGNPFSLQADRSRTTEHRQRIAMREQIEAILAK